jgi:hypothetical protein
LIKRNSHLHNPHTKSDLNVDNKKRLGTSPSLSFFLATTAGLPPFRRIGSGVALAAINWPVTTRLEGNFCGDAALGANGRIHLSGTAKPATSDATTASATLLLLCSSTLWATLGLVGVTFLCEELLLLGTEGESTTTIVTL